MRTLALILLLLATLPPPARAELAPNVLRRAKARIEALLGNRRGASPTPVDPANPFNLPQSGTITREETVPAGNTAPTKSDTLTRLAASLNVSGYVQIQGVPHLIINRQAYRENDLIPVRETSGSVTFLHLKKITDHDFTLELDDAELLQKHTVK
jgi:hypothetical protein